jgi:hypothetical protein
VSESEGSLAPEKIASTFDGASSDLRFAASVAAFSEKLRGLETARAVSLESVARMAEAALEGSPNGEERREFVRLVRRASMLGPITTVARNTTVH